MPGTRTWPKTMLGAAAGAALLGSAAATCAQDPQPFGTVLVLPPGAVLVLPQGVPVADPAPAAMLPDPVALMHQADRMLADAQRAFAAPDWNGSVRMMDAALQRLQQSGAAMSGVVVTAFSDPHGSCTREVVYSANGRTPVTHVSMTGNGCASAGLPTAVPELRQPERPEPGRAMPRTWRVDATAPRAPIQLASLRH